MTVRTLPGLVIVGLVAGSCTQPGPDLAGAMDELEGARDELRSARDDLVEVRRELELAREAVKSAAEALERARLDVRSADPEAPPVEPVAVGEGVTCAGDRCTLERAVMDRLLTNPSELARSVRVVPHMRDGKPVGFKLYGIRPKTLANRLGFENGDTVKAVNDRPVGNVDEMMEVFVHLKEARSLAVEIERRGERKTLTIVVE